MRFRQVFSLLSERLTPLYGEGEAASIARIVLEDGFGIFSARSEQELDADAQMRFDRIQDRLLKGDPVQYVLGQAAFYGFSFIVNSHVLIPRPETEELVHWILEHGTAKDSKLRVLDVGSGSGCIPITLQKKRPAWNVVGVDVSQGALDVARQNAQKLNAAVDFQLLDFRDTQSWEALGAFDLIVSNPPYIPEAEAALMPAHVLDHEPRIALFVSDEDPLLFYRLIAQFGVTHLRSGGQIFLECNEFNAMEVKALLEDQYQEVELRKDLSGKERMIRAWRKIPQD